MPKEIDAASVGEIMNTDDLDLVATINLIWAYCQSNKFEEAIITLRKFRAEAYMTGYERSGKV